MQSSSSESEPNLTKRKNSRTRGSQRIRGFVAKQTLQVPLTEEQLQYVKGASEEQNISMPEVVRKALVAAQRLNTLTQRIKKLEETGFVMALKGEDGSLAELPGGLKLHIEPLDF